MLCATGTERYRKIFHRYSVNSIYAVIRSWTIVHEKVTVLWSMNSFLFSLSLTNINSNTQNDVYIRTHLRGSSMFHYNKANQYSLTFLTRVRLNENVSTWSQNWFSIFRGRNQNWFSKKFSWSWNRNSPMEIFEVSIELGVWISFAPGA